MNIPSLLQDKILSKKFTLILFVASFQVNALDLSINGSDDLQLNNNIIYNYQTNPATVSFQIDANFLCTSTVNSNIPILLNATDANGNLISTNNDGILSTVYDLANNLVKISTDSTIQCASENGLHTETILKHGFDASENDLQIKLLNEDGIPFASDFTITDDQPINYQYIVENKGTSTIVSDIVEFYRLDPAKPFFSGVDGNDWSCQVVGSSSSNCGDLVFGGGENSVRLINANIVPGDQLVIDVSRIANVQDNMIGVGIDLLTAAFSKNRSDTVTDNNVIFKSFGTTDNNLPQISNISTQVIFEDSSTNAISFSVSDVETTNLNDLIVTGVSSNNSIIRNEDIVFGGSGGLRTVSISPQDNTNTASGAVKITISVSDGIATSDSEFTVRILPVNDVPTFSLQNIPDWPASETGSKSIKGFVENLSMGASADESSQEIINTITTIRAGSADIFFPGFEPSISNGGFLQYGLSGTGGTAIIDVTLQDDGGIANNGEDTSDVVSFEITVLNTLPTIGSISNQIFNEDTNSTSLNFTISDNETDASLLTMSASSSEDTIIAVSDIQFSGTGTSRSVQIFSQDNMNTVDSGPVTITLIVTDESNGSNESQFNVTINPINDAPSFSLGSDIVFDQGETGLQQHAGFANNIHMGPTDDEDNAQSVSAFNVEVISGGEIFSSSPSFNSAGGLAYVLDDNVTSGVATISVSLTDNGGTSNGGVDTSATQQFTITLQ